MMNRMWAGLFLPFGIILLMVENFLNSGRLSSPARPVFKFLRIKRKARAVPSVGRRAIFPVPLPISPQKRFAGAGLSDSLRTSRCESKEIFGEWGVAALSSANFSASF